MIESAYDLIQSINPDGHFEFVNQAWHDTLGYSEDDLPRLTLFDVIPPPEHPHCHALLEQVKAGASLQGIEVTFVAKDGRLIPVEGNASGRFIDGEFVATHAFFRDITERKRMEKMTQEYQAQLEAEVKQRTTELLQSEKLATLGRLSAGIAHELNNPAAATQRGAEQLRQVYFKLQTVQLRLRGLDLSEAHLEKLMALGEQARNQAEQPDALSPLDRSDREYEIEDWLDEQGVAEPWEVAGQLVSLGYKPETLQPLTADFAPNQLPVVLNWLACTYTIHQLLAEIDHGSYRISEIVKALKSYTYMDQAPLQAVAVAEGLDNTLIILQAKLKSGITVQREYADNLPVIEAYGSELNQVWTNIIDNAIGAMAGQGTLTLRTRQEDDFIVVEIEDSGPGIPEEIQAQLFDPFFTTKAPGEGTGLGLNISHNIICQKHRGRLLVDSEPGRTTFIIKLPLQFAGKTEAA